MVETVKTKEMEIEMTEDYGIFKTIQGNRKVNSSHVSKLKTAMKQNDLFTPILVNEKLEVIDGQHRLEARKQLGFIVPYIVQKGLTLNAVQMLNSKQKAWNIVDYTESYIAIKNQNYIAYKWFRERYKLPHIESVVLLMYGELAEHGGNYSLLFNNGDFKVNFLTEARQMAEKLEKIAVLSPAIYCRRSFIRALAFLFKKKVFNFDTFLKRLENNPTMLVSCSTVDQYIDLIEEVYNYRSQNKVSLRYMD